MLYSSTTRLLRLQQEPLLVFRPGEEEPEVGREVEIPGVQVPRLRNLALGIFFCQFRCRQLALLLAEAFQFVFHHLHRVRLPSDHALLLVRVAVRPEGVFLHLRQLFLFPGQLPPHRPQLPFALFEFAVQVRELLFQFGSRGLVLFCGSAAEAVGLLGDQGCRGVPRQAVQDLRHHCVCGELFSGIRLHHAPGAEEQVESLGSRRMGFFTTAHGGRPHEPLAVQVDVDLVVLLLTSAFLLKLIAALSRSLPCPYCPLLRQQVTLQPSAGLEHLGEGEPVATVATGTRCRQKS
mmetsp:Transcript_16825/g.41655  ORF Transcript_16825/g.41655 Transcript_16825/m.41655 type:complete len:292 (-) Transcript_16825:353-1228(-)